MIYVLIFFISAFGSFIQATAGFGAAIFMMLFFSLFMPITNATAICGIMCICSNITNSLTYRKHIEWKLIPLPTAAYFIFSYAAIRLAKATDTELLKKIFGVVLILFALYFIFLSKSINVKPTAVASASCGALSGITGGMFGASGPPMVVYFISASKSKESYMSTLQMFCLITNLWSFGVRLANDFYTADMLPMIALGIMGMFAGQFFGAKVFDKINGKTLHIIVYVMLAVSGIINLF